jgi:predicted MPP superfamily phosphohydrolase
MLDSVRARLVRVRQATMPRLQAAAARGGRAWTSTRTWTVVRVRPVTDRVRPVLGRARPLVAPVGRWFAGRGGRRLGAGLAMLAVTLVGMGLGLTLGGQVSQDVGPFEATFAISPSVSGGTEVRLPPLGSVHLRSHAGPAHLTINLSSLDAARTRDLVTRPDGIAAVSATAETDVARGVSRLAWQALAVAILGTMLLAALVFRSMRRVAVCGGIALVVMAASLLTATATFRREAIAEPTYEGLLTNARNVVGDAQKIADRYDAYRDQLQRMVTNVSRLYTTITTLPVYAPQNDTIKILHISDLHLNPAAWSVVHSVVTQFDIDVVIDTGDITDWGTEPEASFVSSIGLLGVPYVYVRGNHDSALTQAAIRRQPNAVVLDNGVTAVAGVRIAGIGDPRFTPDKTDDQPDEAVKAGLHLTGRELAGTIAGGPPVDIAAVHDPLAGEALAGEVPLVLAGHLHAREARELEVVGAARVPRTLMLVEGSTGGAGLRGLELDEPTPLQMSVLYLGPDRMLDAYDEISVGGTGLAEVTLQRHLVDEPPAPEPSPTVTPTPG